MVCLALAGCGGPAFSVALAPNDEAGTTDPEASANSGMDSGAPESMPDGAQAIDTGSSPTVESGAETGAPVDAGTVDVGVDAPPAISACPDPVLSGYWSAADGAYLVEMKTDQVCWLGPYGLQDCAMPAILYQRSGGGWLAYSTPISMQPHETVLARTMAMGALPDGSEGAICVPAAPVSFGPVPCDAGMWGPACQ